MVFKFLDHATTKQMSEDTGEILQFENYNLHNRAFPFNSRLCSSARHPKEG